MPRSPLAEPPGSTGDEALDLDPVPRRTTTQIEHYRLVEAVLTLLSLAPTSTLDDIAEKVPYSRASIQRAFRARGTTFTAERQGILLDRAAQVLIQQHARGQSVALLNAARAAGGYRPRHLCGPFRDRFGLTPGKVWSIGAAIRGLHAIAKTPVPHSRRESAAYARRRRRIIRLRHRLEIAQLDFVPNTVVGNHVTTALQLTFGSSRARLRPRRRARSRHRRRRGGTR